MTDRERLIEILKLGSCPSPYLCDENCKYANLERCYEERTADLLLKHGVIVPPCKFLSKCYVLPTRNNNLSDITETKCLGFILSQDSYNANLVTEKNKLYQPCFGAFGKTVFLTREEAEKALKEWNNNG